MADYTSPHGGPYHNNVPLSNGFFGLGPNLNLPRQYKMGRYGRWSSRQIKGPFTYRRPSSNRRRCRPLRRARRRKVWRENRWVCVYLIHRLLWFSVKILINCEVGNQLAAALSNRDIRPTNNFSSQTQDKNCVFKLGLDYGQGNHRVCKKNRTD